MAQGKHGKYKVWFDLEHGCHIVQAQVHKEQNDIAWRGLPLAPPMPENVSENSKQYALASHPGLKKFFSFLLNNVRFIQIENTWVPISADYRAIIKHRNNRTVHVESTVTCDHIVIHPEYGKTDFVPDNIANGTIVAIIPIQTEYIWKNGNVVDENGQVILNCSANPPPAAR